MEREAGLVQAIWPGIITCRMSHGILERLYTPSAREPWLNGLPRAASFFKFVIFFSIFFFVLAKSRFACFSVTLRAQKELFESFPNGAKHHSLVWSGWWPEGEVSIDHEYLG